MTPPPTLTALAPAIHPAVPPAPTPPAPAARRPLAARDLWLMLGGVMLLALAWQLLSVLMLAFASLLLALALLRMGAPLRRRFGWSSHVALGVVVLGVALLLAGGTWLVGASAAAQLQDLRDTLPRAFQALQQWLSGHAPGRWVLEAWTALPLTPDDWQKVAGLATGTVNATVGAVGTLVLIVALGVYLAADAEAYRRGAIRLVPPAQREHASRLFDAVERDMGRWLVGQSVSMLAVGAMTAVVLMVVGVPLVLTLSVLAGMLEFVPYFGPIVSGIVIVAVALTEGERMALWAAVGCFSVQQLEAYFVQPIVQRWAVRLPPVLGIVSVLVFGLLFGLPGVLLAVPLMVLTMTLTDSIYVQILLESPDTPVPAEPPPHARNRAAEERSA